MKFRSHDTFYIRDGWLTKGMKYVQKDGRVFRGSIGNPMSVFGMGSTMIKSLKYWLNATKITQDTKNGLQLTDFGKIVFENDKYIEEVGTLWLIHYMLSSNLDNATSWYYMFNEFRLNEFDRDDFTRHIKSFIKNRGESVADRSLEDDFTCIMATYIKSSRNMDPESNLFCPLSALGLLEYDPVRKIYKKRNTPIGFIPPLVVLAVIVDRANGGKEIKISSLKNDPCNVGRTFNLDTVSLISVLSDLENMGFLSVIRTAGIDVVRLRTDLDFTGCILKYYNSLI